MKYLMHLSMILHLRTLYFLAIVQMNNSNLQWIASHRHSEAQHAAQILTRVLKLFHCTHLNLNKLVR